MRNAHTTSTATYPLEYTIPPQDTLFHLRRVLTTQVVDDNGMITLCIPMGRELMHTLVRLTITLEEPVLNLPAGPERRAALAGTLDVFFDVVSERAEGEHAAVAPALDERDEDLSIALRGSLNICRYTR